MLILSILIYLLSITYANAQDQEETITTAQAPAGCDWSCQVLLQDLMVNQYEMMDGGGGYQSGGSTSGDNNQDGTDWCEGIGPGSISEEEQNMFNIAGAGCIVGTAAGGFTVAGPCIAGIAAFAESICSD